MKKAVLHPVYGKVLIMLLVLIGAFFSPCVSEDIPFHQVMLPQSLLLGLQIQWREWI